MSLGLMRELGYVQGALPGKEPGLPGARRMSSLHQCPGRCAASARHGSAQATYNGMDAA